MTMRLRLPIRRPAPKLPRRHTSMTREAWEPSDGIERYAFTLLANLVSGVGFALILVAVSEFAGGIGNWRQGLFWGLAGFAVFTLAPGLGLPPELPAMPAADLFPRQVWWTATALATAAGLALIAFRRSPLFAIVGVALIVAPHIVGAPQPVELRDGDSGRPAPPVRGGGDHDQPGVLGGPRRAGRADPAAFLRLVGKPALQLCLTRQA